MTKELIEAASERIAPHIRRTDCRYSEELSELTAGEVYLKLENLQDSGSFKLRGVMNKVLSLDNSGDRKQFFSASTGNHGAAFARAMEQFGLDGTLFMPKTAVGHKVDRLRGSAVALRLVGDDCVEAEMAAANEAADRNGVWISPYNDCEVVAGQGTIAVELVDQMGRVDDVLVPVGGGGLIGGIAAYLKAVNPEVRVVGCQPRASCVMCHSIEAGEIVEEASLPTVSDATAGGIEKGSITFDLCRRFVDDFVLLDEREILDAIKVVSRHEEMLIEGGAALPVAALRRQPTLFSGRRVALILSGGTVGTEVLRLAGVGGDTDEPAKEKA